MCKRIVFCILVGLSLIPQAWAGDKGLVGALIGAGAGAAIGHAVDPTGGSGKGALIGAVGGYLIGSQMDSGTDVPPPEKRTLRKIAQNCDYAYELLEESRRVKDKERRVYLLQKAVRWCPGSPRLHNDLGVAYYQRGRAYDRRRSSEELKYALKLAPDYRTAKLNLQRIQKR